MAYNKVGLNKEQILEICRKKQFFRVHKYTYRHTTLRKKLSALRNEGKLRFLKQSQEYLIYVLPDKPTPIFLLP